MKYISIVLANEPSGAGLIKQSGAVEWPSGAELNSLVPSGAGIKQSCAVESAIY